MCVRTFVCTCVCMRVDVLLRLRLRVRMCLRLRVRVRVYAACTQSQTPSSTRLPYSDKREDWMQESLLRNSPHSFAGDLIISSLADVSLPSDFAAATAEVKE